MVAVLAVLTFAPFKFIHPLRVRRLRTLNVAALILWCLLALVAVLRDLDPGPWIAAGLAILCLYFLGVGLSEKR
jgi:phosphatidylcholine synthase